MTNHLVLPSTLNVRASPRATADSTVLGVLPFGSVIEELNANADRSWLRVGAVLGGNEDYEHC